MTDATARVATPKFTLAQAMKIREAVRSELYAVLNAKSPNTDEDDDLMLSNVLTDYLIDQGWVEGSST